MNRVAALIFTMALAACTTGPQGDPAAGTESSPFASDQSEPLLALADHMLGNYFANDAAGRPTVCASMHDGRSEVALSPEGELALMTQYPSLAPFARCGWIDGMWQDVETDEPAMVFNVHSFTCADDANCTGFGSYTSGRTSSMSSLYTMQWNGSAWTFSRDDRLVGEE